MADHRRRVWCYHRLGRGSCRWNTGLWLTRSEAPSCQDSQYYGSFECDRRNTWSWESEGDFWGVWLPNNLCKGGEGGCCVWEKSSVAPRQLLWKWASKTPLHHRWFTEISAYGYGCGEVRHRLLHCHRTQGDVRYGYRIFLWSQGAPEGYESCFLWRRCDQFSHTWVIWTRWTPLSSWARDSAYRGSGIASCGTRLYRLYRRIWGGSKIRKGTHGICTPEIWGSRISHWCSCHVEWSDNGTETSCFRKNRAGCLLASTWQKPNLSHPFTRRGT